MILTKPTKTLISILLVLILTGCATIFTGFNQNVDIKSSPVKAKVTVNGELKGETPLTVKLRRKKNNVIKIDLEGYEPYEIVTTKGFNFVSLGNIMIGGAIGMLVDLATGGVFTVNPGSINVELESRQAESTIGVGIVENMSAETRQSLTKIGQLTPEDKMKN